MKIRLSYYKILLFAMMCVCLIYELSSIHTETMLLCGVLGMIVWVSEYRRLSKDSRRLVTLSVLLLGVILLYRLIGVSNTPMDNFSVYLDWTVVLLFGIYLCRSNFTNGERYFYILVLYALITVQLITAIIAARATNSSLDAYSTVSLRITEFGSMAMFFASGCFIWFLNDRRLRNRILSVLGIVLSLYVLFAVQQRLINAFCTLVLLGLILLTNNKRKKSIYVIYSLIVAILIGLYVSKLYIPLLDSLISNTKSVRISERLADVKDFLMTGDLFEEGRFSGRSELLRVTLTSWTQNFGTFLFGVGDHRGTSFIGNHCEYIDMLGRYGIVGGVIVAAIAVFTVRFLLSFAKKETSAYQQMLMVGGMFVVRNFLGIVSVYQVGFPLLIFTQMVVKFCDDNRRKSSLLSALLPQEDKLPARAGQRL